MIPVAFEYRKAQTVEDAIGLLSGGETKLLAGGYSLLPSMKLRLNQPSKLIDISNIPSLKGIKEENGNVIINAGTTHYEIGHHEIIKKHLPFFVDAVHVIGDVQVRNRGTIGGSLAHADPAADWPALVLAAEAIIEVMGRGGIRSIPANEFFTGLFSTQIKEDEIITAIRVPIPRESSKMAYLKFSHPASRFAIVGCAVIRFPGDKTNIAFTGIADTPFRDYAAEQAVSGKSLDLASIESALSVAVNVENLLSDNFASQSYRKHLAKVYLKRALQLVV
ncbi:MAG: xanthine dehydrogenase family protein subunit M [Chitinophagaceae bacterium]